MKNKYLEYYMNSKIYTEEDIKKSIEETKKEFPNKKFKVNVFLNRFDIYEITFEFEEKNSIWNKMKIWLRKRRNTNYLLDAKNNSKTGREEIRFQKYSGNKYGEYKKTGTYKPY